MSVVANRGSLRLQFVTTNSLLGTNNGCKILANVTVLVGYWADTSFHTFLVYLYFVCLEKSFEVKVEAATNGITECPCDDKPSICTLCFLYLRHH